MGSKPKAVLTQLECSLIPSGSLSGLCPLFWTPFWSRWHRNQLSSCPVSCRLNNTPTITLCRDWPPPGNLSSPQSSFMLPSLLALPGRCGSPSHLLPPSTQQYSSHLIALVILQSQAETLRGLNVCSISHSPPGHPGPPVPAAVGLGLPSQETSLYLEHRSLSHLPGPGHLLPCQETTLQLCLANELSVPCLQKPSGPFVV